SITLDVTGTLGGVRFPLLTTTQRNALTATNGLMIYCTDCLDSGGVNAGVLQVYQASSATWKNAF
ncbi:MAG TPA: hypothetical protein VFM18_07735, partial [Methanosarcina sp.]|nr:hypothetical protein [Methanosarcina sp.]